MLKARSSKLSRLLAALAVLFLAASALPRPYVATARVLLPPQSVDKGVSRMRELREVSGDPASAQARLREALAAMPEAIVVDPAKIEAGWIPAWLMLPAFLLAWLAGAVHVRGSLRAPDRRVVREAVLLAQRGHPAVLVERAGRYRVVLGDSAADRATLPVLALVRGGAPVLVRRA